MVCAGAMDAIQPRQSHPVPRPTHTHGDLDLTRLAVFMGARNPSQRELFHVQSGRCVIYGKPLAPLDSPIGNPLRPTIEHVFPRSHGCGTYANKALTHHACNQRKGQALPSGKTLKRVRQIYRAWFPKGVLEGLASHPLWALKASNHPPLSDNCIVQLTPSESR